MTNPNVLQYAPPGLTPVVADSGLKSLAQALDQLVADNSSYLYLTLPERTVAEIQRHFTINTVVSGITGDASR